MLKRVATGVGVNIFDKLVVAITQLSIVPLLAHAWGLHLYGTWVMLSTVPTFLAMGDLGFATAAGTKMTIAEARGNREEVIRIFQSAWAAILLSSVVFTALALGAALGLPAHVFGDNLPLPLHDLRMTLLLLLLYGILVVQGSIFFAGFRAAGQFALGAFWNAIIILIESGALIVVVAMGGSPVRAAMALLIGRLVGLIGQNMLLRHKVAWLPIGLRHADRQELRSLIAPAGAVMLLPISQACLLQGTALALGAAAGAVAVPAFTAARTLSRIGQQMCWTVNAALMPEVSAAIGRRDKGAIAMMTFCTLAVSALLVVPFSLGFAVLGRWAVDVWSHHVIHPDMLLIATMALSILFGGFWFPMSNLIMAADRQGSYTGAYALLAIAAVPVSYIGALYLGGAGPAIAMALSDGLMLLLIARLTDRYLASPGALVAAAPQAWAYLKAMGRKMKGKFA